jgi:hypothetical protein
MVHVFRKRGSSLLWLRCLFLLIASCALGGVSFSTGMLFWWPGLIGVQRILMAAAWVVSAFLAWAAVLLAFMSISSD